MKKDVSNITKLPDMPNRKNGGTLDADEFKAEFDKAGNDIKDFLNNTLIPYLEGVQAASSIGLEPISGLSDATNIQTVLEALKRAIDNTATGDIPDRSLSGVKLIENSIGHTELGEAAVEAENIADKTITGGKLADKTITGGKLADKTITGGKLADACIEARHMGTAAVGNANIQDNSIDAAGKLADASITAKKYAPSSVPETALQDKSVTKAKLASDVTATALGGAPAYTYSTTDLTAGTSSLTTGKIYLVYE